MLGVDTFATSALTDAATSPGAGARQPKTESIAVTPTSPIGALSCPRYQDVGPTAAGRLEQTIVPFFAKTIITYCTNCIAPKIGDSRTSTRESTPRDL